MPDEPVTADFSFPSDLAEARRVQGDLEAVLHRFAYSEHDVFSIRLAMEEVLVNAIKHGNQLDHDKSVFVQYRVAPERFDVKVTDEGPGFNPEDVPDPTADENLERPCGRGLLLIRGFMTDVRYHGKGNVVTMSKVRSPAD